MKSVASDADGAVVQWRWAAPMISVEPLLTERLFGRRTTWRRTRPRPDAGVAVGLDEYDRIRVVRDVSDPPRGGREVLSYDDKTIDSWTLGPGGATTLQRWSLKGGRITESVRVGLERSWWWTGFAYDDAGRVSSIQERFWVDEASAMTFAGEMRFTVSYDASGALDAILRHWLWDDSKVWAFRAHPPTARDEQARLDALVRDGLFGALKQVEHPETVYGVCLLTSTTNPGPPTVYISRDKRLADPSSLDLDDLSPLEWGAAPTDVIDLGSCGTWQAFDDDASVRRLRKAIRQTVSSTSPAALAAALESPEAPLLFAMDTERTQARQNLRDAFDPGTVRGIVRRARAAGQL